jgi:hypothetical protein
MAMGCSSSSSIIGAGRGARGGGETEREGDIVYILYTYLYTYMCVYMCVCACVCVCVCVGGYGYIKYICIKKKRNNLAVAEDYSR